MSLERSDFKDAGVTKVGHIKKLQKGIRDIQNGKMPRRLLHATCGVTSVSQTTNSTATMSYQTAAAPPTAVGATVRLSPKTSSSPMFGDDEESPFPSREESFG